MVQKAAQNIWNIILVIKHVKETIPVWAKSEIIPYLPTTDFLTRVHLTHLTQTSIYSISFSWGMFITFSPMILWGFKLKSKQFRYCKVSFEQQLLRGPTSKCCCLHLQEPFQNPTSKIPSAYWMYKCWPLMQLRHFCNPHYHKCSYISHREKLV